MGYVVKPDACVHVRFPGDRALRLMGGDAVPEGLPEAQYERLDRAGLIVPAEPLAQVQPAPKTRKPRAPRVPKE